MIGAVIVFGALWLALLSGMIEVRRRDQRRLDADRRTVRLHFPPDVSAETVVAFTRSLVMLGTARRHVLRGVPSVVFEVVATPARLEHRLHLPVHRADELVQQLPAAHPGIEVEPIESPDSPPTMAVSELRLSSGDRSLRTDQPDASAATLLAALTALRHGERIVVAYAVTAPRKGGPAPTSSRLPTQSTGWAGAIAALLDRPTGTVATPKEWRGKHAEPVFPVAIRIGAEAATPARAGALVRRQVAVLRSVERPGISFLRRDLPRRVVADRLRLAASPAFGTVTQLNAKELAVVIAWPVGRPAVAGLNLLRSRRLAPSPAVPTTGRLLGVSNAAGAERPIAISLRDGLNHLLVLGPTGTGKTTLMTSLAIQDLQAGRAVVAVDPKGGFVEALADHVPPDRIQDVIWIDVTDAHPVGFNVLEGANRAPERVSDQVVGIFARRFGSMLGPRSRDLLHASCLTLAYQPTPMSLVELPRIMVDEAFRRRLVGRITGDVVLEQFWAAFEAYSPAERSTVIAPLMNKARSFLLDRRVRACVGQTDSTWTMDQVLNERKILLVSLSRGELGSEAAALTGSLLVSLLWQAVQRRAVRLPVSVYLDEYHDLLGMDTDLAEVMVQARGFGISVCLAGQHVGQVDPRMRSAVMANARTKIVFQTAADDAAYLARQLGGGLTPEDLMGLPVHRAFVTASAGGEVSPPFSLATKPLPPGLGRLAEVRDASRHLYGRERAAVEAAIAARQSSGDQPEGDLGRRRRLS